MGGLRRAIERRRDATMREINSTYAAAAVPAAVAAAPEDTRRLKSSIRVFPSPGLSWAPPEGLGVYVPADEETARNDVADLDADESAHVTVGVPYGPEQDRKHRFLRAGHEAGVAALRSEGAAIRAKVRTA